MKRREPERARARGPGKLFEGKRVLLVMRGMPSLQINIVLQRLREQGAVAEALLSPGECKLAVVGAKEGSAIGDLSTFTEVVTVLPHEKLVKLLLECGLTLPDKEPLPVLHTLGWVTESLVQGRRMPDKAFVLRTEEEEARRWQREPDSEDEDNDEAALPHGPDSVDTIKDESDEDIGEEVVGEVSALDDTTTAADSTAVDDDTPQTGSLLPSLSSLSSISSPPSDASPTLGPPSPARSDETTSTLTAEDEEDDDDNGPTILAPVAKRARLQEEPPQQQHKQSPRPHPAAAPKPPPPPEPAPRLNGAIIDALQQLADSSKLNRDHWRERAYLRALAAIKAYTRPITSSAQLLGLRGVGMRIRDKVDELLATGRVAKLVALSTDQREQTLVRFLKVHGAGPEAANRWYASGFRTYEDLRRHPEALTAQQQLGVRYVEEFQQRIPRCEVAAVDAVLQDIVAHELCDRATGRPLYECVVCGSYRRKHAFCGDIDVLVTHAASTAAATAEQDSCPPDTLPKLVGALKRRGVVTDDLTDSSDAHHKYYGVCCVPQQRIHRRIDISLFPRRTMAYALLHFTGSGEFNRALRLHARRMGFSLGETGLYPAHRAGARMVRHGPMIPAATEQDIFALLHVRYLRPEERDTPVVQPLPGTPPLLRHVQTTTTKAEGKPHDDKSCGRC